MHGTGFVAEVWDDVARELASDYSVYALDRRGHGDSHKPASNRYHFHDFAEDVCGTIEALGLSNIYGIGHSAGATDLLLAAKLKPERFSRLFVMEPTVMDPRMVHAGGLSDFATGAVQGVLRRQAEFESAETVFQRYQAAPAFADWTASSLRAYIQHGFAAQEDGRVRLLHTRIGIGDPAADLRSHGAGLHWRCARQPVRVAVRDRLPGTRCDRGIILGNI
jgi:pimeloyl-ACP methyl ester carboxylesterase